MDEWKQFLVRDQNICHGQLTVRGTRIPVSVVLDSMSAGCSEDELLDDYPTLTPEAVAVVAMWACANR